MAKYETILLKNMEQPGYAGSLAEYEQTGGYQALRKVLKDMQPNQVIDEVKKSLARPRGRRVSHWCQMGLYSQGSSRATVSLL